MGFFNTIGLLALIGVPLIIILHMLKRKQKDVHVPSIYLWERATDTSVQSKPWQKLKKSLPLILQLAAAASLGLAAARPYISAFGTAYNYVIVMDTSSSMSAEDMGESRLEYAKERAGKLILPPGVPDHPPQGPGCQHHRPRGTPCCKKRAHKAQNHSLSIVLCPSHNASYAVKHLNSPPFCRM